MLHSLRSWRMDLSSPGVIQILAETAQQSKTSFGMCSRFNVLWDVVTWGSPHQGGHSSEVQDQLRNVRKIQAALCAFSAILADGSLMSWRDPTAGGDSFDVQDQLRNVKEIQATEFAFAAILAHGGVATWGYEEYGGDSSGVQDQLKNVQEIQATEGAFAAILADGSIVTWGGRGFGGDSSKVQHKLENVQQVQATGRAFAAIRDCTSTTSPRSSRAWCAPATMAKCREGNQAKVFGPCMQLLVMLIWFCLVSPTCANEVANQFAFS